MFEVTKRVVAQRGASKYQYKASTVKVLSCSRKKSGLKGNV